MSRTGRTRDSATSLESDDGAPEIVGAKGVGRREKLDSTLPRVPHRAERNRNGGGGRIGTIAPSLCEIGRTARHRTVAQYREAPPYALRVKYGNATRYGVYHLYVRIYTRRRKEKLARKEFVRGNVGFARRGDKLRRINAIYHLEAFPRARVRCGKKEGENERTRKGRGETAAGEKGGGGGGGE